MASEQHSTMSTKLALVTGSTSGIGEGIALVLSSKGYDVAITGFGTEEQIQSTLTSCRDRGATRAEYIPADLSDHTQIESMFVTIREKFGRGPDVLVNNAGIAAMFKGVASIINRHAACCPNRGVFTREMEQTYICKFNCSFPYV